MTIEKIEGKVTNAVLTAKMNELVDAVNNGLTRDRGPKSERAMTEADALRCISGDLADKSHKECATELTLSYGQIYSARKGFTFKSIHHDIEKAARTA